MPGIRSRRNGLVRGWLILRVRMPGVCACACAYRTSVNQALVFTQVFTWSTFPLSYKQMYVTASRTNVHPKGVASGIFVTYLSFFSD